MAARRLHRTHNPLTACRCTTTRSWARFRSWRLSPCPRIRIATATNSAAALATVPATARRRFAVHPRRCAGRSASPAGLSPPIHRSQNLRALASRSTGDLCVSRVRCRRFTSLHIICYPLFVRKSPTSTTLRRQRASRNAAAHGTCLGPSPSSFGLFCFFAFASSAWLVFR